MSISYERVELIRKVLKIGQRLILSQKESLQVQIIDQSVAIIIDDIVTNEQVSKNTILALNNFFSAIEKRIQYLEKKTDENAGFY